MLPSPIFRFGDIVSSNSTMLTMESPPWRDSSPTDDVRSPENCFDKYSWFRSIDWLWKIWGLEVLLPFVAKLWADLSARILGEKIEWLWAKYMLIDSLCLLDSSPRLDVTLVSPPFLSDTMVFSSFCFSFCSAFLDSRSVAITACCVSNFCYIRVADKLLLVMLLCLKACFLIRTVFSSSIWRRFISKILLLCISSRSISRILARSWLITIYFLLSSCSSFYTPFSFFDALSAAFRSFWIWILYEFCNISSFSLSWATKTLF